MICSVKDLLPVSGMYLQLACGVYSPAVVGSLPGRIHGNNLFAVPNYIKYMICSGLPWIQCLTSWNLSFSRIKLLLLTTTSSNHTRVFCSHLSLSIVCEPKWAYRSCRFCIHIQLQFSEKSISFCTSQVPRRLVQKSTSEPAAACPAGTSSRTRSGTAATTKWW